ncbi:hypothetical protein HPMBJEAJ_00068 [Aeromonas phage avDM6]|nr:hypothetical protein HPMBJEAJ_00068 [Aeromonas phage avDM6]
MKLNADMIEKIWNSNVKLNEWFIRGKDNTIYFIDVEQRHLVKHIIKGNQQKLVFDSPFETVDISKLVDMIDMEIIPDTPEGIILFLNEIASWFEMRYADKQMKKSIDL